MGGVGVGRADLRYCCTSSRSQSVITLMELRTNNSSALQEGSGGNTKEGSPMYSGDSTGGYPTPPASILSPSRSSRRSPQTSTKSINWEDAFQDVGSGHTSKIDFWSASVISCTQPGAISSVPSPLDAIRKTPFLLGPHVARGDSSILFSFTQAPPIMATATTKAQTSRNRFMPISRSYSLSS